MKKQTLNCHVPATFAELFYRIIRGVLYSFTFILCIFGLSLILFAFWYLYEGRSYHLDNWIKFSVFTGSFLIGVVLFTFSSCGLIAVLKENMLLARLFLIGTMILVAIELTCIFLAFYYKKDLMSHADTLFEQFIVEYTEDADIRTLVDTIQSDLKCCGISSPDDWENNEYYKCDSISNLACSVPASCCYHFSSQLGATGSCGLGIRKNESIVNQYKSIYITGCKYSIYTFLDYKHKLTSTVLIGIVVPQLIGVILIICYIVTLDYLIQYDLIDSIDSSSEGMIIKFDRDARTSVVSIPALSEKTESETTDTTSRRTNDDDVDDASNSTTHLPTISGVVAAQETEQSTFSYSNKAFASSEEKNKNKIVIEIQQPDYKNKTIIKVEHSGV